MADTCGLGPCFRPAWLRKYATPRCFLIVYGLLGTIQAMAYIYFVATLTTLEKRFKIPSKTTGFVMSGNEISQILLSLTLSYYGGQGNRPLWIAWGVAFSGLSCYILVLPHMVYGPGKDALSLTEEYLDTHFYNGTAESRGDSLAVCSAESYDNKTCGEMASMMPLILIFLSQFVLGIGSTLYYALGQPYLDDNVKKTETPMLLGCVLAFRTLGPAVGFALGSGCLSVYIDPSVTPVITRRDPRWLGAWWLGWIILGTTMLMFSFIIALFPKYLPSAGPNTEPGMSSPENTTDTKQLPHEEQPLTKVMLSDFIPNDPVTTKRKEILHIQEASAKKVQGFGTALKRLLKNQLLMANIVAGVFYILGASGYMTYTIKYLETQFQKSAAGANIIAGVPGILATVAGFLISGYIISRFKPRASLVLGWNVFVGCVYIAGEILFIFLGCTDNGLQGFQQSGQVNLLNECNINCHCDKLKYTPVCSNLNGMTYYSACHAGCNYVFNSSKGFGNCTCLSPPDLLGAGGGVSDTNSTIMTNTVTAGPCPVNCGYSFIIFVIITCVMHSLGSSGKIGNILVNYRCVAPEDKSFAQGLVLVLISLLAFIPGPIIFGIIIDAACLVWDGTCGERGHCWLYHKDNFRLYLNLTAAGFTTIGVLLDVVVWRLGRKLDLYDDTDTNMTKEGSRKNSFQQLK